MCVLRGSRDPVYRFVSHNCRGLNDKKKDGIQALVEWATTGQIYATGLQETWRGGMNTECNNGWLLVTHGLKTKICKRIIFMVSAYAPTTSSTKEVRDAYKDDLLTCLDACRKSEWSSQVK